MSSLIEAFQNLPLAQGLSFQNALSPKWWLSYAVKAYEDDPFHVLIEFSLFIIVLWLIFRKSYDPKSTDELSKQEEDALIADWKPEPLVKESGPKLAAEDRLLVDSAPTPQVTVNGKQVTNFCSTGFLGLAYRPEVKDAAKKTIEKYGVGSCGPRGFYGSIDVHLNLEKDISAFLQMPESILYSDAIACVPSVIAAFAKRGDLIVCDDGAHFGIQQGLTLARCNVLYFKHNDMQDLERVLQDVREKDQASSNKKLHRRFIMVEGLSANHGDVVPLNKIMELKDRYKYRVILDDSLAVGVLGKTGRGTPEMFNIPTESIDIVTGVLDGAFGSVGGYCVGLNRVVDHQRLAGAGYCFSASAPPYTSSASSTAISIVSKEPQLVATLQKKAQKLRAGLKAIAGISFGKDEVSPLVHIRLQPSLGSADADSAAIKAVQNKLLSQYNIATYVPEYIPADKAKPVPSLRVCVMATHSDADIDALLKALKETIPQALKRN